MSAEVHWTPQQQAAVEHVEGALLVSAAAGSGKTAVLAARCAYLVCDAREPCDVDQLLVLTFTRAAAAEMKERIDAAIRKCADRPEASERILRQLRLIDRASITTIDAFCGSLVREHFHLVGVDPGFAILAPEDARLLQNDVASDLIESEFDSPTPDTFRDLLDGYFGSDVDRLRRQILSAHALSQSIVDPAGWIRDSLDRVREGAQRADSALMISFTAIQKRVIHSAIANLDAIIARAGTIKGLEKYAAHARDIRDEVAHWLALADAGDLRALATRVSAYQRPRLPSTPKDTPGKALIQAQIDDVKEQIGRGELHRLLRWTQDQLRGDLQRILPLAERFFDLVARFTSSYDRAKRGIRSLDFADVEALALKILSERDTNGTLAPSPTAMACQDRFRHVLVDEFQDINPLQYALLRLVSRDRAAELSDHTTSNLFSVGDVKQSIYRFRLAEPRQFIERHAELRGAASKRGGVIDLQENFRSRSPLLEAINDIFRRLMTAASTGIDYDQTHELRSVMDYAAVDSPFLSGKPIEMHVLPRDATSFDADDASDGDDSTEMDSFEREVAFVAERVRAIVKHERPNVTVKDDAGTIVRPAKYGDVVVLLRSAKFKSSQVADALRARGIPVHSDDATGFFTAVEVQDVLSMLRVLSNSRQDVPLAAVLRSPFFDLGDKEDNLAKIRAAYKDVPFHRAVELFAKEGTDTLAITLRAVLEQLAVWRRTFREKPIGEALRLLIEHNGFSTYCRALRDGAQRVANLNELLARGEAFDAFERQGLDRFLAFLTELETNDELGRPSLGAESDDVVRVMTVHKSKGLEFPIVVIPDLGKKFNTMSLSDPILLDRDLGIGMMALDLGRRIRYPSLASIVVRDHMRRQAVAEEVRVLYVALTRAREHLILVGTAKADVCCRWTEDWAEHDGALPDNTVQDASTPLDWLGPIAAMTERAGLGTFKVVDHAASPLEHHPDEEARPTSTAEQSTQIEAADLKIDDPVAQQAIARINYDYPHPDSAAQRATAPLTDFVGKVLPGLGTPLTARPLNWPTAYKARERATALEVGSATHLLLQLLDFHGADSRSGIQTQLTRFVEAKRMSAAEASLVDLEAIVWFSNTNLAELIREAGSRLLREQSLALLRAPLGLLSDEAEALDRRDRVLVRGRIDAIVQRKEGLTLIDYKSDRLNAADTLERAAVYEPQLQGYADALTEITGQPVVRAAIVFLATRRVVDLRESEDTC